MRTLQPSVATASQYDLDPPGGRRRSADQRRPTAVVASRSTTVVLWGDGLTAMSRRTFALKTKITVPVEPELATVYSTALSPIPVTGLAFVSPEPAPVRAAA